MFIYSNKLIIYCKKSTMFRPYSSIYVKRLNGEYIDIDISLGNRNYTDVLNKIHIKCKSYMEGYPSG